MRGGELRTKEQIEKEISRLEAIPEQKRTKEETGRLGVLKDTRLFDSEYYVFVRNGKGGRERLSPIIGKHVEQIVERIRNTPEREKVWKYVNRNADIHSYRAHARPIEKIPYDKINKGTGKWYQSEVYTCRKDEAGKKLERRPCWCAARLWDTTGLAWWPTTISVDCKGGMRYR